MNKKILVTLLTLGVVASVGYFGTSFVLADDENPVHQTLISKIAQKFNLKETDVEAVFTAVRDERQSQGECLGSANRGEGRGMGMGRQ